MDTAGILKEVLAEVERQTGCPVEVRQDPTLKLMAKLDMARGPIRVHRVAISPAYRTEADYLVAFQCGFILRKYGVPPEERVDLISSVKGRIEAEKLVRAHVKGKPFPAQVIDGLTKQLFDGLILQLVSVPSGLRVDDWIAEKYPPLASQQRTMAVRQLQENTQTLSPEIRSFAPERILKPSVTMNAAHAAFWARLWGEEKLTLPYRTAGYAQAGAELLKTFDKIPADPSSDRTLIEAWGEKLGVRGWFEWVPYRLA